MPLGTIALLLAASFGLGALPLTRWMVRVLAGKDLRALGTGNVGVSAAFIHGGKLAGIAAVLAEIARGIIPVLAARFWFPDQRAIALTLLIPLVAGRSAIARGGGVTNAVWGVLAFSPPVAVTSGISGLLVWSLAEVVWGKGDRARLFATRCGCLSTPIWVWVWRQNMAEFLAAAGLALLLTAINLSQGDDMAFSKSEQLLSLDDSLDAKVCGDKAAKLSQLKRGNFNVPPGWILLKESGIGNRKSGLENRKLRMGSSENSENLSIPNSLIEHLKSQIPNRMIVRSSAAGEDGDISSAAGQYQTIGPVFTETELSNAINSCRQSYWTSEAVAYRRQRQLPDTQMAVLIQPYIDSKIAGVMFSRNPLDGGSQVIIEALPGGAESVVGGQFTPVHLEIDFSTSESLEQSLIEIGLNPVVESSQNPEVESSQNPEVESSQNPEVESSQNPEVESSQNPEVESSRRLSEVETPEVESSQNPEVESSQNPEVESSQNPEVESSQNPEVERSRNPVSLSECIQDCEIKTNSIIDKSIVAELVKQAQAIEAFFHGIPQDIEWSWDGEKLWILQSRPITNLQPFWTRTIAAEVIPGAIRPLTWSINRPLTCGVWGEIFKVVLGERAANLNFNETATLLGSHAYFNATLLGEIFRMMGLPEQGLEFLLRGQKMGKPPLGKILPSLPGLWRLVQRERALNAEFKGDRTSIFLPALESLQKEEGSSATDYVTDLTDLTELLERAEQIQEWLKPITYYNILGPIGLAIRKAIFRVSDEWLDNDSAPEIASVRALQQLAQKLRQAAISQSDKTISFAQLTQVFEENSALLAEFEKWLNTYGYLSEVGTDIAVPTWREQPETYQKLLVNMATKSAVNNLVEKRELPLTFWQKWRLDKCQERATVKNEISQVYARLLAHLRWTFLEIEAGGLAMEVFQEAGDIFYLEFGEIQQWIRSGASVSFQDTIRERREQLKADRDRPIPPVVYGNLLPNSQKRSIEPATSETNIMQGIPASIGRVEGFVKICRTVTTDLGENAIVVVPYTDAGWAPLLLGATAIIAEVGGQLSHGAIIAREYKIPAVMNISEATTRLRDGQKVRVDGYLGTVELLE